jgi:N-acetylmuramoyl-L-alanine amidase
VAGSRARRIDLRRIAPYVAAAVVGGCAVWLGIAAGWLPHYATTARWSPPDPVSTPPERYTWTELPAPAFPIPPYARYLKDVTIVLDPGHGGRAARRNWKRGPTGLREAVANLRVAQFLREFLIAAGADVVLTRETDVYLDPDDSVDLKMRADLANRMRADLFLSIHHNAAERTQANYTALFYHKSPDHSPASLCAARHLLAGLNDALRLETHLECALLSDELLQPNRGLAVLREARVPAVLSEASFHSNPTEERRLREPAYNRREAYGLFLGLARWAQAGLPRVHFIRSTDEHPRVGEPMLIRLDDGLSKRGGWAKEVVKIVADSLVVKLEGRRVPYEVDLQRGQLRVVLPNAATRRPGRLYVDFENIFGQHVLHPRLELRPNR